MFAHRYSFALALLILLGLCTGALADDRRLYASLHPYYAEACAVSQIKKKLGFGPEIRGGPGGHSILYLNGVCRDRSAHYPKITLCGPGSADAPNGVGISANAHFKNANWIATDGRDFFFRGDLPLTERLTHAAYERTQAEAKDKDILDGVEFHDEVFDEMPAGVSRRDYMYEMSISTDYAIDFGRDRYCAQIPMTAEKMGRIVEFLNGLNALYRDGAKEYQWNVLQDNCSHLTHNALAAVGLWNEWPTNRFVLFAAFDFPVPANEFVNLTRRTNDLPLDDLKALYDDKFARSALMEEDRLPTEPGAVVEWEMVRQANDLYDTDVQLIFYDESMLAVYQRRASRILAEPRYFDIRQNLTYFSRLYEKIDAERKPVESYRGAPGDFSNFYDRFYRYIDRKRAEVESQLASLPSRPQRGRD